MCRVLPLLLARLCDVVGPAVGLVRLVVRSLRFPTFAGALGALCRVSCGGVSRPELRLTGSLADDRGRSSSRGEQPAFRPLSRGVGGAAGGRLAFVGSAATCRRAARDICRRRDESLDGRRSWFCDGDDHSAVTAQSCLQSRDG